MSLNYNLVRELGRYNPALRWWAESVEERMSANADAIEAAVTTLRAAEVRITAKIAAVQAAVDAGEDLTAPLASLATEVTNVDAIAPVAPAADVPSA